MKTKFEHVDGRIYLEVIQQMWALDGEDGSFTVLREDVTDSVMELADERFNYQLQESLKDYKRVNGIVTYVGEDKDKYQK